jgi:hypothetical protein
MKVDIGDAAVELDATGAVATVSGSLRLSNVAEYAPVRAFLDRAAEQAGDALTVDLRGLAYLNSAGITTLSLFVLARKKVGRPRLTIRGSTVIAWQDRSLKNFGKLWNLVDVTFG